MNDVVNRFGYAFDAAHGRVPGPIAPLQDEPQDENSIRPIKTTKTVLVPQIQSMKDYILRHHKRMILGTLNRNIREGMLRLPMALAETNTVLTSASCSFRDMNFWRVDKYTALADVIIDVDVFGDDEIRTISLYAEMWINMEKGMQFRMGECGYLEQLPERPYWRLSNYLIPILRKEEIEAGGEELLLRLIPDALTDKQMHNPFVLAERMGLQVMRLPLYDNTRTLSMLFFAAGTVTVQDDPENEDDDPPPPYTVTIPQNTILINTHAVHKDYCQLEVYHECIHYDWHFMFYRLQDMHNNDVNALKTKRIVVTDTKKNKNPLTWMEWQANRGSFALMMPLGMMRPVVGRYWNESSSSMHYGKRYDYVARRIASEYDLPKFRVRARLIQMGKIPAKGALNYVDGSYIEPFAFDIDKGNGDYTFVLTRKNLFAAYNASGAFREQIDSGRYVFVDGHICINDERYVRETSQGLRLTPWANEHVDECCLRFINVYVPYGISEYRFGCLNSDEEYNRHYLSFAEDVTNWSEAEKMEYMGKVVGSLPDTFPETLSYLMEKKGITEEKMEELSGISVSTISRLRRKERSNYSIDQIIAICVTLHLPPWLSSELLSQAGILLRRTKQHRAYRMILDCLFMDSLDKVQGFLVEAGCERLKLKAN